MNCKPGDLAVIARCNRSYCKAHLGKIVRCVGLTVTTEGLPGWDTEPVLHATDGSGPLAWLDDVLRPIRDPGEDAQDETLSWLPVPTRDEVPA